MRLIDADALYKAMQDAEELARRRVLDTESTLPDPTNLNPAYTRYLAQMDERIRARRMVESAPTVDAVPVVRCKDCKHNPKLEWLGCPMASLNEKQRPETAWCWKGEQKDGDDHES